MQEFQSTNKAVRDLQMSRLHGDLKRYEINLLSTNEETRRRRSCRELLSQKIMTAGGLTLGNRLLLPFHRC